MQAINNSEAKSLEFVARYGLWVRIMNDLGPALNAAQGESPHKVAICSIPKSGTHFVGAFLEKLGFASCGIHIHEKGFTDYRFGSLREKQEEHERMQVFCPLEGLIRLVRNGQFIYGHIACSDEMRRMLSGFKVIFSYRELRTCMVSQMRFYQRTGRRSAKREGWGKAEKVEDVIRGYLKYEATFFLKNRVEPMIPWLCELRSLPVCYEVLMGDHGEQRRQDCIRDLCTFLDMDRDSAKTAFEQAMRSETITRSAVRSRTEDYWNEEAEVFFRQMGGVEMNRKLGFGG
jgi:hypothetical protein